MSSSEGNTSAKPAVKESAPAPATAATGSGAAESTSRLQGKTSSLTGLIMKATPERGTPRKKPPALVVQPSDISVRSAPAVVSGGTTSSQLKKSSKKPPKMIMKTRKTMKIPSPRNFIQEMLNETHTAAAGTQGVQFTKGRLKQLQYWDVQLHPISKQMIGGHLVPTVRSLYSRIVSKPRRITLEWYEPTNPQQEKQGPNGHHRRLLIMKQQNTQTRAQVFQSQIGETSKMDSYDFIDATDMLTFHIYKKMEEEILEKSRHSYGNEKSHHSYGNDDDSFLSARVMEDDPHFSFNDGDDDDLVSKGDDSTAVIGGGGSEGRRDGVVNDDEDVGDGWTERYRVLFQEVDIVSDPYSSKLLNVELNHGKDTIVRGIEFPTFQDKMDFVHAYYHLKKLFQERAKRLADNYKKDMQQHQNKKNGKTEMTFPMMKPKQAPPTTKPPMKAINENEAVGIQCGPEITVTCGPDTNIPQIMNHLFGSQGFGGTADKNLMDDTNAPLNGNDINLLVEIVSASDLTIFNASEYIGTKIGPYVKVFDGDETLHRTKVVPLTEDPIWTLSTGSFFLIRSSAEKFFQSNFLTFDVMLNNQMNNNEMLGCVDIAKSELLKSNGERIQYELLPAFNRRTGNDALNESLNGFGAVLDKLPMTSMLNRTNTFKKKSFLALRVRHATNEDVQFLIRYRRDRANGKSAIYAKETFVPPRHNPNMHIVGRNKRYHKRLGVTQYRAKPYPDPERVSETMWMTKDYLEAEAEKLSRKWIETGSGTIGKIFVEVIGCDDIPNLDSDLTSNNLSDPYVCLTYEDCVVNTDVIANCLKPRWMPWTQRAFVLRMNHPSSQISLGVFDRDTIGNDDFIGRAVINVSNFRPNTTYRLKYNLHALVKNTRTFRGSVTVRIRVRFDNERRALIAGMSPPARYIDLNVADRKNFRAVNLTLANEQNPNVLRLRTIVAYISELQSYRNIEVVKSVEFFVALLLWRSHKFVRVRIPTYRKASERTGESFLERWTKPVKLFLPLRSMIAFAWGIAISRNYELIPSCLVFLIGWAMNQAMTTARERPDPWKRPRSFLELLHVLVWNKTPKLPPIQEYENLEAIIDYQTTEEAKKEAADAAMESITTEQQKIDSTSSWKDSRAMDVEAEDLDQDFVSRAKGSAADLSLAPKPISKILLPVQLMLHGYCVKLRVLKSILMWRDCYISFWVAIAIWSTSLLFAIIPWTIILKRTFTISVWVFLGPWMKLFDIFWYGPKHANETPISDVNEKYKARYKKLLGESMARKLEKESTLKNKDMRAYMFGRFPLRVPYLKEELHHDDPTSASFARPLTKDEAATLQRPNVFERKEGQLLQGDMIPTRVLSASVDKKSLDSKFHKTKML